MDTNTILLYVSLAINALLLILFIKTELRLKHFWRGKNAKDLEDTMRNLIDSVDGLAEKEKKLRAHARDLDVRVGKCIRNVETVRFNPFQDSGSNQSFAVSLVNDDGDGVILSSLYSRERVSVFAKPIKDKTSTYELSEEERKVLEASLK